MITIVAVWMFSFALLFCMMSISLYWTMEWIFYLAM